MAIHLDTWPIRARCPGCGEICSHKVLFVSSDGSVKRLRCKSCGHEWTFERKRDDHVQRSEAERRAKRLKREVRTCPWCGREFVPKRNAIWCSSDCRVRGQRHYASAIAGLIAQTEQLERKMREVS